LRTKTTHAFGPETPFSLKKMNGSVEQEYRCVCTVGLAHADYFRIANHPEIILFVDPGAFLVTILVAESPTEYRNLTTARQDWVCRPKLLASNCPVQIVCLPSYWTAADLH
jgi:hypothetical protein